MGFDVVSPLQQYKLWTCFYTVMTPQLRNNSDDDDKIIEKITIFQLQARFFLLFIISLESAVAVFAYDDDLPLRV